MKLDERSFLGLLFKRERILKTQKERHERKMKKGVSFLRLYTQSLVCLIEMKYFDRWKGLLSLRRRRFWIGKFKKKEAKAPQGPFFTEPINCIELAHFWTLICSTFSFISKQKHWNTPTVSKRTMEVNVIKRLTTQPRRGIMRWNLSYSSLLISSPCHHHNRGIYCLLYTV